MIDNLLNNIAPHHCYLCAKSNGLICQSCIYNITDELKDICLACREPARDGTCSGCRLPYDKSWVVSDRTGEVAQLIDDFKWKRKKAAYKILGQILDESLPILPNNTLVMPVPTISRHIRIRGYDHAYLMARYFCKKRGLKLSRVLKRKQNTIQHKANKNLRIKQAKEAFCCKEKLDPSIPYLIVDDIVTTGSTTQAATRVLKRAGAREVWVAAVARQPLKK